MAGRGKFIYFVFLLCVSGSNFMVIFMTANGINSASPFRSIKNETPQKPETIANKSDSSKKAIIGVGFVGLAALAATGIYIATKGKVKAKPPVATTSTNMTNSVSQGVKPKTNPSASTTPTILGKKLFANGTKVTKELIDGEPVIKVFDKEGNLIKSKTKEITRFTNLETGKKYVTIKGTVYDSTQNNPKREFEINRYYLKNGKKLFEVRIKESDMYKGYYEKVRDAGNGTTSKTLIDSHGIRFLIIKRSAGSPVSEIYKISGKGTACKKS